MNINKIKELKEKLYEIEGLAELAVLREDRVDEIAPLIQARIIQLQEYAKNCDKSSVHDDQKVCGDNQVCKPSPIIEKFEEAPAVSVTANVKEAEALIEGVKPRPVFCLNDRFRFCRELFGNSENEFNSTLNLIAAMHNYAEAEDYFLNELGWDADNAEVSDFLEIIKIYFN